MSKSLTCPSLANPGQMLLQFLPFWSLLILHRQLTGAAARPLAPAVYVFGDSLLDSGNNNLLPTVARANYHPYGVDFSEGVTGRFTNGRTVADFISEYVGVPYPPPVIGIPRLNWLTGFNYASGSCGILPNTGRLLGKCLNLDEQLKLFEAAVDDVLRVHYLNPRDLNLYLSKSIFVISVGNNDYINNYLDASTGTALLYNAHQFSDVLIQEFSKKLKRLYELGARKVVVFELGPIGCVPSIRARSGHIERCDEEVNGMVRLFNNGLGDLLSELGLSLPGSHFVLGQAHGLGYDAIVNPTAYGLRNSRDPCCKSWMNNTQSCIPQLTPCDNPNQHYFWDAYHLTEATCSLVASQCINASSLCVPLNLQQLLQL